MRTTVAVLFCVALAGLALGQKKLSREEKVRADKKKVEGEGFWIYNDLDEGFAEAKRTKKPLIVVLRCVPCEECVKLDDDLIDANEAVKPLLEKFVRVRLVSTNGLDLSLFQFDYDQSFAAFFFNADRTIYGRFGTRSHRTAWVDDVSVQGLARALEGALALHEAYPADAKALAGRKGPAPEFASPEKFPSLKDRYGAKIDYAKKDVVPACIHCHQIGDAQRTLYRKKGEPMPEALLTPYPHPKSVGLILDPKERAKVTRVEKGTPAAEAGFRAGDAIESLGGQPLLSLADVQWVLHQTPADGGAVKAAVRRAGKAEEVTLKLPAGWRRAGDTSWRSSTWGMRRMTTGGLVLEAASAEERKKADVAEGKTALRVKHVGQFGAHAAAKAAGFRAGDVVVSYDGRDDLIREQDVIAHAATRRKAGERVAVVVARDGERLKLTLPMQE